MRVRTRPWIVIATAASLAGLASAQQDQAAPPQAQADLAPPAELTAEKDVQLTPQQMLTESTKHLARIDQVARSVGRELSTARQERDVVKVLCLNDKLNQINVALASATDRQKTLEARVKDNSPDAAKHEYTLITVLRNRVETLLTEANQCVGEEAGYLGDTQVDLSIDPEIPDSDPGFPDDPFIGDVPTIVSAPRVPASPG